MSGIFCLKSCVARSAILGLGVPPGPKEAEAKTRRKSLGSLRHWGSLPRDGGQSAMAAWLLLVPPPWAVQAEIGVQNYRPHLGQGSHTGRLLQQGGCQPNQTPRAKHLQLKFVFLCFLPSPVFLSSFQPQVCFVGIKNQLFGVRPHPYTPDLPQPLTQGGRLAIKKGHALCT